MSTINQYERWREREREVGRVVYWCGGGLGNEIQCGGGLGDVIQCGGRLVELQSWVLEDLAVELEQGAGPTTCCSVVADLWGATVGFGLGGGVELTTCSGLAVDLGCGAVIGALGEASTDCNECRGTQGTWRL